VGDAERVFPDDEASIPGRIVGRVESVRDAVAWVAKWAFDAAPLGPGDDPAAIRSVAAPIPGGSLWRFEVRPTAFVVTGATEALGTRPIRWPDDPSEVLPIDLEWTPGSLVVDHAPLFAAPAWPTPPARERSGEVTREGALWVLGHVDRCAAGEPRSCLRWVQIVARRGDRFVAGYIPAHLVAERHAWRRGTAPLPRFVLRPSVTGPAGPIHALTARTDDGRLRTTGVALAGATEFAGTDAAIEPAPVEETSDPAPPENANPTWHAVVSRASGPTVRIPLTADLDRRPRPSAATTGLEP
jgi:hypothetical protein